MKFLFIENKERYLNENYIFSPIPKITDRMTCSDCGRSFIVGDFKVIVEYNRLLHTSDELIVCPNAPKCDGTILDWVLTKQL